MDDTRDPAACGQCGKPIAPQQRGRPRRWCSDACRKAAQRARNRPAVDERRRAAQLAVARAEASRAWKHLQATAGETQALAGAVLAAASGDPAGLETALAEFGAAARELADLARRHAAAARRADDLGMSQE